LKNRGVKKDCNVVGKKGEKKKFSAMKGPAPAEKKKKIKKEKKGRYMPNEKRNKALAFQSLRKPRG